MFLGRVWRLTYCLFVFGTLPSGGLSNGFAPPTANLGNNSRSSSVNSTAGSGSGGSSIEETKNSENKSNFPFSNIHTIPISSPPRTSMPNVTKALNTPPASSNINLHHLSQMIENTFEANFSSAGSIASGTNVDALVNGNVNESGNGNTSISPSVIPITQFVAKNSEIVRLIEQQMRNVVSLSKMMQLGANSKFVCLFV